MKPSAQAGGPVGAPLVRATTFIEGIPRDRPRESAARRSATQILRQPDPHEILSAKADYKELPKIDLIVSDVDGTLLNSNQELTEGVEGAVQKAAEAGVPLVVATGKARGPWVSKVLPRLGEPMPGVFLQGLLICDGSGQTLYERALEKDLVIDCIEFANKHDLTLTAYCGDRILCAATNEHTDRLIWYEEPTPEGVGPLEDWVDKININKMIMLSSDERIKDIRPLAEDKFISKASLTTALPGMLEILPLGSNKGTGVAWLLKNMNMDPKNVMAIGDGENDVEMLQLAGFGIAMGNAGAKTKAVADCLVSTNDQDGVAEAIHRFILKTETLQ